MINKYRVHEVAKDFDIKSNIVVDLLAKHFDGQKKHMTALEEDELDVIFETFTKENEVEDLNDYFNFVPASKKEKEAPAKEEAPVQEKKEEAPAKKAEPQKEEKASAKKEEKKEAKKEEKPAEKKPVQQSQKPGKLPPMPQKKAAPALEKKEKDNKPMQSRTKGEMRTIDTRADNVDLEKYNERYE
ncbi:MAG: translation initiation factor IF-2 N-terminal domain-containing protein, partial [Clostridia bacterium]|nr:translation initiation factor IF-2 N-terminal domain-containing protein [Clostridia bacterium]